MYPGGWDDYLLNNEMNEFSISSSRPCASGISRTL